ncbi:MAG: TonB-dependent receptor family protein [Saprospiraceae bacterium]|nr:TonB-dependent receptor family protein [Saprospiraceae bacterium]
MFYSLFSAGRRPLSLDFILTACTVLFLHTTALAQYPPGGNRPTPSGPGAGRSLNGRFYGKVLEDVSGKPVGYATVQLLTMQLDSTTGKREEKLVSGQLTKENGDFSLENIPVRGRYTLRISFMGFDAYEQSVAFDPSKGMGGLDRDLGNIRLKAGNTLLKEVTVTGDAGSFTLAMDKKVYNVDKDGIAAGGTAEDALRNIPTINVDIDGNVTLRNAAPQIFVDGRPTTLTIDQIPADAIDNVEIITNPSAKYDASGGNAGIVNIVLKKERRLGYNGNLRAGVDMRGKFNFGADLNAREGKFNAFLGLNYRGRKSLTWGETDRQNLSSVPQNNVYQDNEGVRTGYFSSVRGGVDWLMDNRNTLSFVGNMNGGNFDSEDEIDIQTDTFNNGEVYTGFSLRNTESDRFWRNYGGQILFKHLSPKPGKEWTADLNLNQSRSGNDGFFQTDYFGVYPTGQQKQETDTRNTFITGQTDWVNPITESVKLEYGARGAVRTFDSDNANFQLDPNSGEFNRIPGFADAYSFTDQVYAAYTTYTQSFEKWGYQAGLRVESSFYQGDLPDADTSFTNDYPLSLFPSTFFTYKLNEEDNLQLSYTRRINRPNFFQLIPFPDYSDSLLLQVGNPNLRPEFTNNVELAYQNIFNKQHNLLVSVYYQLSTDLITNYQFSAYDPVLDRDVVVSTYVNANQSQALGTEWTMKNTFREGKIELVTNLNLYNSIVDATNVESELRNEQFSWFVKENVNLKLPAEMTFQVSGSYQSRTAIAVGGGDRSGGWHGGPSSTAQGYTLPVWFVDMSLRKDLWNRTANINISVRDVFRSRVRGSYSETGTFIQEQYSRRDPQFVSLNFSWRFGKFDASLFKRKNTKTNMEGMDGGF